MATNNKRILFVLTNHSRLGSSGNLTGWYLPEAAHPYYEVTGQGYDVDFCSPQGGPCPVDKSSLSYLASDPACARFYKDSHIMDCIASSIPASTVDLSPYSAVFYVGGHGPMWDVAHCAPLADKVAQWYVKGGKCIAALCHGPAGLVNVCIDGQPLVSGCKLTCFSNEEEGQMHLSNVVPFLLESKLKARGAILQPGPAMQECVVADVPKRIVTGQNPASAAGAARAMLRMIESETGLTQGSAPAADVTHKMASLAVQEGGQPINPPSMG